MAGIVANGKDQKLEGGAKPAEKLGVELPTISAPKGGGAIRGMGEKFGVSPVTGTGSISVPIPTSPGRFGFGPQLSLSYDSGHGNGPFGFGWSLSVASITRKTDKGLPQYSDADDSDVFILSGVEDLVAVLGSDGAPHDDNTNVPDYTIRRYRPRIEGLFSRIERWTRNSDGDVHWRSISRDNILALYGNESGARIVDSKDPKRIFSWLICEARDDKGNAILYGYKHEDGDGADLGQACEYNRGDRDDPRRSTNRYLKTIRYCNRGPLLNDTDHRPRFLDDLPPAQLQNAGWMFEVVLDYGEHDANAPRPDDTALWMYRDDPFSSYRAGFEVRTTRLCRRVLMFHHIPDLATGENGYEGLVRSTDFAYSNQQDSANPVYTFLRAVTQCAYRRSPAGYDKASFPPLEFEYTVPIVQDTVEDVDPGSLENLPIGLDGATYQWTDLHGEGIPGILTEQAGGWFYKRNISPIGKQPVEFAPLELARAKPNHAITAQARFIDLAGDGLQDFVLLDGPSSGFYEHDGDEGWEPFRSFPSCLNRNMLDPNLRFVDLDGDGHADVLITEDDAFVWHPSLQESGFGPARRVGQSLDEERGPRLVFADGTQSIYLADISGDGLIDLVRLRNGAVCYWPNLGYGHFGAKVTMDDSPNFDNPDQFDQKRIRLADIDGSGTTDIIYLHRDGVRLYFNQSGNSWSKAQRLNVFPRVDDLVSIVPTDLLGNGTACLVWSSPLPGDGRQTLRYVNLMGGQKPHLLVRSSNNLGAETIVQYASSTRFYLQDKRDGKPWLTRLAFPVHVVERIETWDRISRNRFVTRYAYHHGYFDGEEREFRGFGMVEQWDTEELAALLGLETLTAATNGDVASHVPPVLTRTWFHTGVFLDRDHISDYFAGLLDGQDKGEYYREPGLTGTQARELLLADTVLPPDLTPAEERDACRALKGSMLRQEVYALDGKPEQEHPYTVTEQNFRVRLVQAPGKNRHAVFLTHENEVVTYHYERNPDDPRVQHALTLEVDPYGNVLKQAAIGYGRRQSDASLPLQADRDKQTRTLVTYSENRVTNPIDDVAALPDDYRTPLPCEARTFELTGYPPTGPSGRFLPADFVEPDPGAGGGLRHIFQQEFAYEDTAIGARARRPIEWVRTLYCKDNLTELLPLSGLAPLALPGESYKLAFTPGLLSKVFQRNGQPLLPSVADVLGGQGPDRGGYLPSEQLKADGRFPNGDLDGHWWLPAGRVLFSPNGADTAAQELAYAQNHFFLPLRYRDPFHTNALSTEGIVTYDAYDLLMVETRDALGNQVTVGERRTDSTRDPSKPGNDYRVLQPTQVMDPNGNRAQVALDVLGMVAGTAVMGKPEENLGDSLNGFSTDLSETVVLNHLENPLADPRAILGRATTRLVYDLFAYFRTRNDPEPQPVVVYTLVREIHDADQGPGEKTKVQHSFSYSDGFGREVQKKIQAEPEKIDGALGSPRWVGSGWTIFNNKGKPVRQYEAFFTATHRFEFGVQAGVSPVLFYDPVDRVVATLNPNYTYSKVVFDAWRQITWDVNDTVIGDPRTDGDVSGFTAAYFASLLASTTGVWQTWYAQRQGGALGKQEQAAAAKAEAHADTPARAYLDTLGRPFLTLADNGPDPLRPGEHLLFATRIELDIEGNQRAVRDAIVQAGDLRGRIVMRYDYDMLGNLTHQSSMEAGQRWVLNDVTGKKIRSWDNRDHGFRTEYDALRRPLRSFGVGADAQNPAHEILFEENVYGESISTGLSATQVLQANLRGKLFKHYDTAGVVTSESHDFKGNLLRSDRQLAQAYKAPPDWSLNPKPALETELFTSSTRYDALNRPIQMVAPHSNKAGGKVNIIRPGYNEANLLERMDAWMGQSAEPSTLLDPTSADLHAVIDIDYDAKGQRTRIGYGNNALTEYSYDKETFRLTRLKTSGMGTAVYQDLSYFYDPVGNITHIGDDAQQTVYFNGQVVLPHCDYAYDAIYRLINATGREHIGQLAQPQSSWNDEFRINLPHPGDGAAMRCYTEQYLYDAVGNFEKVIHQATNGNWTRSHEYAETSLIEDGSGGMPLKTGNRLSISKVGVNNLIPEHFDYDTHGNVTSMPHLTLMKWDFKDQLSATSRQVVNASLPEVKVPETTFYVYDSSGQRIRKATERQNGSRKSERVYLGGFEIYREFQGSGTEVILERESVHIMDDRRRIALVETRTQGSDGSPMHLVRYQFANHLESTNLELDDQVRIVSYEEYTPYGSTSYQAVRSKTEGSKRYRYTGKERDEETGLNYHGARYYASWLGRWTAADPIGLTAGVNLYAYVRNNPIRFVDPHGTEDTPPPPKKELGFLDKASLIASFGFTLVTHQTPSQFGKGVADKVESLTVTPVRTVFGPSGLLDKAAQKAVDKLQGLPDKDYVTKEEHDNQLRAIIHIGGSLFPGFGEITTITGPPLATAEGPLLASAVTAVVPNAATAVPVVVASTAAGGSGGGSNPTPERIVVGRGTNTNRSSIPDPPGVNTKTLGPKSTGADLTSFLQQAPTKFPELVGKVKEILLERLGLNPTGVGSAGAGVTPEGIKAARELLEPGGKLTILQQPLAAAGQSLAEVESQIRGLLPAGEWGDIAVSIHKEQGAADAILATAKKL